MLGIFTLCLLFTHTSQSSSLQRLERSENFSFQYIEFSVLLYTFTYVQKTWGTWCHLWWLYSNFTKWVKNFKGVGSPTLLLMSFILNRHCPGYKVFLERDSSVRCFFDNLHIQHILVLFSLHVYIPSMWSPCPLKYFWRIRRRLCIN